MSGKKPVVLIADDDPEILSMLSLRLGKKGYATAEAEDGVETLRQVREARPDVILLDVMMPRKNGWEVAREIRADPSLHHVGIIMLTAIGEKINEMTSPLYGADDFVDKPFDFNDLEERIRKVVAKRQACGAPPRSRRAIEAAGAVGRTARVGRRRWGPPAELHGARDRFFWGLWGGWRRRADPWQNRRGGLLP